MADKEKVEQDAKYQWHLEKQKRKERELKAYGLSEEQEIRLVPAELAEAMANKKPKVTRVCGGLHWFARLPQTRCRVG